MCVPTVCANLVHCKCRKNTLIKSNYSRHIPCLLFLPWSGMLLIMICTLYSGEILGFHMGKDSLEELQICSLKCNITLKDIFSVSEACQIH